MYSNITEASSLQKYGERSALELDDKNHKKWGSCYHTHFLFLSCPCITTLLNTYIGRKDIAISVRNP